MYSGSVVRLDQSRGTAHIRYRDNELELDTSLLGSVIPLRNGSAYMLIGEMNCQVLILLAIRLIEGLEVLKWS